MSILNENVDYSSKNHLKSDTKAGMQPNTRILKKQMPHILLLALLVGAWAWAVSAGTSDISMSGWVPLGFGGISTLVVVLALISSMFYNSHRNYDER